MLFRSAPSAEHNADRRGQADGRTVWYQGRRIDDVLDEPELRVAVEHSALDFLVGHDPQHRELAVAVDPATGDEYSAYYRVPRSTDDLLARMGF